jgi:hypothetical protein
MRLRKSGWAVLVLRVPIRDVWRGTLRAIRPFSGTTIDRAPDISAMATAKERKRKDLVLCVFSRLLIAGRGYSGGVLP